jgi:hypothetical protein
MLQTAMTASKGKGVFSSLLPSPMTQQLHSLYEKKWITAMNHTFPLAEDTNGLCSTYSKVKHGPEKFPFFVA